MGHPALKCPLCSKPGKQPTVQQCDECGGRCCAKHIDFRGDTAKWECNRCFRARRAAQRSESSTVEER